jgi:hypothetical protein
MMTQTKSPTKRFRVLLEKDPAGSVATGINVPFDVLKVFGSRARVPVRGTINGFAYRSSIFPMRGGKHFMVVNGKVRAATNLKGGETVTVTMERDDAPRIVTPPADLLRALRSNKEARATWEKLSYTHRKEYVQAIEDAKRPETRARRIAKTIEALAAGKKQKYDRVNETMKD